MDICEEFKEKVPKQCVQCLEDEGRDWTEFVIEEKRQWYVDKQSGTCVPVQKGVRKISIFCSRCGGVVEDFEV